MIQQIQNPVEDFDSAQVKLIKESIQLLQNALNWEGNEIEMLYRINLAERNFREAKEYLKDIQRQKLRG